MNGLELLSELIRSHPYLKEEDHVRVEAVASKLDIPEESGYINQLFKQQVQIEAMAVYLLCKYSALKEKLQAMLLEHRADKFLELGSRDEEGLKWTKTAKEDYLLATDIKYIEDKYRFQTLSELITLLESMKSIVFGRNMKLEQLSNNYRREQEIDRRQ